MLAIAGETVSPPRVDLAGPGDRVQLVVRGLQDGWNVDYTRTPDCVIRIEPADLATLDDRGRLTANRDGTGQISIVFRDQSWNLPLTVSGVAQPPAVDFDRDVQPILTRFSCNAGACHGKQRGQNGFQLSLLGFDSQFDYDTLTKEGRGRRTLPSIPEASLLLTKPANQVPHGGGKRLDPKSADWALLRRWIAAGTPRSIGSLPALKQVRIEPTEVVLARQSQHQLRVIAEYADGSTDDVTRLAAFQSNESAVAAVDEQGLITAGSILGDAAVMARFQGMIAVTSVLVPHPQPVDAAEFARLPQHNLIDGLVWKRLEKLRITPSVAAGEPTVLRRLYLDLIGRGPTAEEARKYLDDASPDKRAKLIDALLDDPEYAEHWASKWADLLRPNPYHVGIKATLNYDAWIRQSFRKNQPYDEFVRELITAQGSTFKNGNVTLYRDRRQPAELATIVSQLFLGVRLECAKCHHHPFEVYGQEDFYSFAAYFARIGRKGTGISAPISGSEEFVFVADAGQVTHPLTGAVLPPRPLFGTAPDVATVDDPRAALAAWITADENPYFGRTIANRLWADLMGRGLVDPVDDLRATNPPSNPELLDALAQVLRTHKYDQKALLRTIANSYVYGLSSLPSERNAADHRNFSRHYRQRLRAEVLFDTICQITGVPEDFAAMPSGSKAKELWTVRVDSLFLDAFGRQDPNQDPPCERNTEPTIVQALHLMNSNQLFQKVSRDGGQAAKWAASTLTPDALTTEIWLSVFGRYPTAAEQSEAVAELTGKEGATRRAAIEDLLWALLNTPEFVFED